MPPNMVRWFGSGFTWLVGLTSFSMPAWHGLKRIVVVVVVAAAAAVVVVVAVPQAPSQTPFNNNTFQSMAMLAF